MKKYHVRVNHAGRDWWLRGTVWAFEAERATLHDSLDAAVETLEKARKFMVPSIYKRAIAEEVQR